MYQFRKKSFKKMIATIMFEKTIEAIKELNYRFKYQIEDTAKRQGITELSVLFLNLELYHITSNLDRNGDIKIGNGDILYLTKLYYNDYSLKLREWQYITITKSDIIEYERHRKLKQLFSIDIVEYDKIDYDILGNENYIIEYKKLLEKT